MFADVPVIPPITVQAGLVETQGDLPWTPTTVRMLVLASFPPATRWRAEAVGECESHFEHRATNPRSGAAGVFQFLPSTWTAHVGGRHWNPWWRETPYDPQANVWAARVLSKGGTDWSQWSC